MSELEPGLVVAPDGQLWLRVPVAHFGLATDRGFRRGFLSQLRKVIARVPAGTPLDLVVECEPTAECCRRESLDRTQARLSDSLEDYLGSQYRLQATLDLRRFDDLRAAGYTIRLPDGSLAP